VKKLVSGLALLSTLVVPLRVASAPLQPPPALTAQDVGPFLDGIMPYAIKRADIAGAVIVIVKDGKIIVAKGYGYADKTKHAPVDPATTMFRIGSVSKLFAWTSVMQLVEDGKLNLDTDVNQYLDFKIPAKYGKPITLRNLMTHTPGFSEVIRDLFVAKARDLYPLRSYLIEHMPNRMFPPGKVIAYSNYGAALAGYIVQRVSGQPYATYVADHILKPLGMTNATFVQPLPKNLAPYMAKGYSSASASKPTPFEYVEASPAGSGSASAIDMAHFMLAYLQGGQYDGQRILKPSTIKEMWTLQVAPAPGMNGFDLGFYQENRNGLTIVGHAGDTDVFHSDLHLLPQQHIGVFMSFNSAGKAGAAEQVRVAIFRALLDRYFPYTPPAERTISDPKADAARVAGWYQSSRREDRALLLLYAMSQSRIVALPNGNIEVFAPLVTDLAGNPLRWREVGPLYYREIGGKSHLKFVTDSQGRVVSWTTDEFIPVEIEQRVNGLKTWGSLKFWLTLFVIVLILSLIIGIGTWFARWRLGIKLELSRTHRWIRSLARIGAVVFLLDVVAWPIALSGGTLLSAALVPTMTVLYLIGVLAIIGGLFMILEAMLRVARGPGGPGGWLVMGGKVLLGLGAIYGIWVILAFGLANFVTNF
jgi:CubicO group peptidase (beta-lactamase class C family)